MSPSGRRNLKIHSELLTDAIVDLWEAGAIDSHGRDYMDGFIVGTFAGGSQRLYDFIDRNPAVLMMPVEQVNDPRIIARNRRFKAINSTMMADLFGQAASDALSGRQVSGIGGQLEFVTGAQWSEGGRSILCLKSTSNEGGARRSAIVGTLPPFTPVSVPRPFADVVVTEHGVAEMRLLDTLERAHAMVDLADPQFRPDLEAVARRVGLWEHQQGFDTVIKRALFNNLPYVRKVMARIDEKPDQKASIVWGEVRGEVRGPQDRPHAEGTAGRASVPSRDILQETEVHHATMPSCPPPDPGRVLPRREGDDGHRPAPPPGSGRRRVRGPRRLRRGERRRESGRHRGVQRPGRRL